MPRPMLERLLLTLLMACAGQSAAAETGSMPAAISTRQSSFTIPYDFSAASSDATPAVEVQLHVSTDLGASWQLAQQRNVAVADPFEFSPVADGEHWFAIRTIDAAGEVRPIGPPQPELRVNVDRTGPDIRLSAQRVGLRLIRLRWYVTDNNLLPESFSIAYQTDGSGPVWKPLALTDKGIATAEGLGTLQGETEIAVDTLQQAILLKADAVDSLENHGSQQVRLEAPGGAGAPRQQPTPERPQSRDASMNQSGAANTVASVNARQFELEYQVDHVDADGVGEVEIWGTRDGGQNWIRLGADDDRRSPCPVAVQRDGTYGFAIVVHSAGGLRGATPQPGTTPEAWVRIDTTAPLTRLTTAEQVYDAIGPALAVQWQVSDPDLAAQPISLSYAQSTAGPWIPLATDLENSGQHLCRFARDVGREVYLKVDARDAAGNVGTFATTRAIRLEHAPAPTHATTHQGVSEVRTARLLHVLR